jgi:hypothetical protein
LKGVPSNNVAVIQKYGTRHIIVFIIIFISQNKENKNSIPIIIVVKATAIISVEYSVLLCRNTIRYLIIQKIKHRILTIRNH